ncbi:sporulation inhibitor of replication protein SirA [Bacillus sp. 1P06AnD]|uniref:sporulation inhibitor of replication protein SirA n=1 Tax=Bacillus sp. 1P06AnD TaxID=3132208 RepID=UPI0039A22D6B
MVLMRQYQIYLIKEHFAGMYVGREQLLYSLFLDYYHARGQIARIIGRQIVYVTKRIPSQLTDHFNNDKIEGMMVLNDENGTTYQIDCRTNNGMKSSASLEIHNRVLYIQSVGSYEAETIFFEFIRKCADSFLAVELAESRYGWLKPRKKRKLI